MHRSTKRSLLVLALSMLACSATPVEDSPELRAADAPDMSERFDDLHHAYLDADGKKYTPLLRATLRHARRMTPAECVALQSQLVEYANEHGYDGLEPLWLVYQDGAASDDALAEARKANQIAMRSGLFFAKAKPHAQLHQRVTHWNSRWERGVRTDALREVLRRHAAMSVDRAARTNLHEILADDAVEAGLCNLPRRKNQYGQTALPELARSAGCVVGTGANREAMCEQAFGPEGDASVLAGMSPNDIDRLSEMCNEMVGTGSAGTSGIDGLDMFSSDGCFGEDAGSFAEELPGLLMECYFGGGSGNPVADGATSANFDRYFNRVVTWERDDGHHAASLVTGSGPDDPGRDVYMAEGDTPEEAAANLIDQIVDNPPEGAGVTENEDGSVTIESSESVTEADGSTTETDRATTINPDGSVNDSRTTNHENGSGSHHQSQTNSDGSSTSTELTWDEEGNVTSKTTTTTDADGNTKTETETYDYDEDGTITNTSTSSTTTPGSEDGFDPSNPACQELMEQFMGIHGDRSSKFDMLFDRGKGPSPTVVYPTPDAPGDWKEEPACGAPTLGGNDSRSHCTSLVLCAEGSELDDNCQCVMATGNAKPLRGCLEVRCSDGATPTPIGAFGCACDSMGEDPPIPTPPDVTHMLSDQIWNRPNGDVFVTTEMANEWNEQVP